MYRLFIDEVGNGDMRPTADLNARYLSLTGYLTRQTTHDLRIQPRLDEMKAELFGHSPSNPVILHRREMMRREGVFACLCDENNNSRFNNWLLEFLEETPALVLTMQVNKHELLNKYTVWRHDPYHYCMQCMMERYVRWLNWHNVRGDVFIEARGKEPDRRLSNSYERLYNNGTKYVHKRAFQAALTTKKLQLRTKKANVAGLQIADLIAHPSARHMRHAEEGRPTPNDFGGSIVRVMLQKRYYRDRETMDIAGIGLKWLP